MGGSGSLTLATGDEEVVLRRIYSLDYLKLVLAVLVAFGHTSWLQSHPTPLAAMLGNGLMRTIVPLFCIVSGYFFYTAVARGDGMKWLRRVLGLYLIWMAVYLPFWLGQVHDLISLIKTLVFGYFHLWFMAGILLAGFVILFLRRIMQAVAFRAEIPVLIGAAALCAVIGVVLQYLHLFGNGAIGVRKFSNGLFMCFPYVTIGYLYARQVAIGGMAMLPSRRAVLSVVVIGAVLLMIEARNVQIHWGNDAMLDVPLSAYLAAPALFLATLGTEMPPPGLRLDPISAAIYFMHVLGLILAVELGFTHLAGMMLFAVGLPTLIALVLGRLGVPGFAKGAPRQNREGGEGRREKRADA